VAENYPSDRRIAFQKPWDGRDGRWADEIGIERKPGVDDQPLPVVLKLDAAPSDGSGCTSDASAHQTRPERACALVVDESIQPYRLHQ
jgi:hypothetical protein